MIIRIILVTMISILLTFFGFAEADVHKNGELKLVSETGLH